MLIFEEGYPYMNNFHVPVKRDVKSAISVFPPKKNEIVLSLTLLGAPKTISLILKGLKEVENMFSPLFA
jgi:hypothetical protein